MVRILQTSMIVVAEISYQDRNQLRDLMEMQNKNSTDQLRHVVLVEYAQSQSMVSIQSNFHHSMENVQLCLESV